MALHLYDSDDVLVASSTSPENGSATVNTSSLIPSDLQGYYYVMVDANEVGEGWYNLSFSLIAPPMPNLVANQLNCPTADLMTDSGNEWFGASVSSTGGPTDTDFGWQMWLVNENGENVLLLHEGAYTDPLDGYDGEIFSTGGWQALDSATIPTGNYSCVLTVDGTELVIESNETDNILTSDPFHIQPDERKPKRIQK